MLHFGTFEGVNMHLTSIVLNYPNLYYDIRNQCKISLRLSVHLTIFKNFS